MIRAWETVSLHKSFGFRKLIKKREGTCIIVLELTKTRDYSSLLYIIIVFIMDISLGQKLNIRNRFKSTNRVLGKYLLETEE